MRLKTALVTASGHGCGDIQQGYESLFEVLDRLNTLRINMSKRHRLTQDDIYFRVGSPSSNY